MTTGITSARVFDGERVLGERTVVIEGPTVAAVGGAVPAGAAVVGARGATLMPGLIEALALALKFGVTTELEMQGHCTVEDREAVAQRDDVADFRSAGFAITPPGGHPSELFPGDARPGHDGEPVDDADAGDDIVMLFSSTPE